MMNQVLNVLAFPDLVKIKVQNIDHRQSLVIIFIIVLSITFIIGIQVVGIVGTDQSR